jgi:acyl-coenzyme A thioesterase PaaI-like protein
MMKTAFSAAEKLGAPRGDNLLLKMLGTTMIPSLGFVRPKITAIDDQSIRVRIPLGRRSKNHLGSMYFGVLAAGADTAAGFLTLRHIRRIDPDITLIFKDFQAEFLQRVDGHGIFVCEQGEVLAAAVRQAADSGERVNITTELACLVEGKEDTGAAARFRLTVSLKRKAT